MELTLERVLGQSTFEARQISTDNRLKICVERRRRCPLEFPDFRQHLMRRRHVLIWPHAPRGDEGALLVFGVRIGIDKEDGERLRAAPPQRLSSFANRVLIDFCMNRPVGERPLAELKSQIAIRDRNEITP